MKVLYGAQTPPNAATAARSTNQMGQNHGLNLKRSRVVTPESETIKMSLVN
jgi:hypothetical protein